MAYVESEVIVKHIRTRLRMGIILRGVEVDRTSRVLDLSRTLKDGGIDYLAHPEAIPSDLATLPLIGSSGTEADKPVDRAPPRRPSLASCWARNCLPAHLAGLHGQ